MRMGVLSRWMRGRRNRAVDWGFDGDVREVKNI